MVYKIWKGDVMKKILFFMFFIVSIYPKIEHISNSTGNSFYAKQRQVVYEDSKMTSDKDYKFNDVSNFRLEIYDKILTVKNNNLYRGVGIKFEEYANVDSSYTELNCFIPIYFSVLYTKELNPISYYGKFNIGKELALDKKKVNELDSELTGGVYYGIETGIIYENIYLGISYGQTSSKLESSENQTRKEGKVDIDSSIIGLVLGYNFNIN